MWFVVLQVIYDGLIFCYNGIRRCCLFVCCFFVCCFSLLGMLVIFVLVLTNVNYGTLEKLHILHFC